MKQKQVTIKNPVVIEWLYVLTEGEELFETIDDAVNTLLEAECAKHYCSQHHDSNSRPNIVKGDFES